MSKIMRDDIDKFYQYGVDLSSKTLFIGTGGYHDDNPNDDTGVNYVMAEKVIKGLHILDNRTPNKKLNIIMNNIGGDEYHGLAIYDAIKACKSSTIIRVFGKAMSMGAWILQAADKRYLSKHSIILLHYGTFSYDGHAKDFDKWSDENKRLNILMEDHLLKRIRKKHPRYTKKCLQELIRFDKFLTANEAIELGLADKII